MLKIEWSDVLVAVLINFCGNLIYGKIVKECGSFCSANIALILILSITLLLIIIQKK